MKKEIKMENSLTPKNNISPKSDFAVLTHITAVIIRLKRGMFGLTRHNPQYKLNQKISYGLLIHPLSPQAFWSFLLTKCTPHSQF